MPDYRHKGNWQTTVNGFIFVGANFCGLNKYHVFMGFEFLVKGFPSKFIQKIPFDTGIRGSDPSSSRTSPAICLKPSLYNMFILL